MLHRTRTAPISVVTRETFKQIWDADSSRDQTFSDAPSCPLYPTGKCDCRTAIREFAIASEQGHPCGENGKCPVRTYLAAL